MFRIKDRRVAIGLTQTEFGNRLGVDQSTVSMWENGKAVPRAEMLLKLADVLGCTVDELLRKENA